MNILNSLLEMTMRGGNFSSIAERYGKEHQASWKTEGKHIGDIDNYQVKQYEHFYSLWDKDLLIGFNSLTKDKADAPIVVDIVWINPDYQGKKLFSKMLWFYKTRLGHSKLMLGDIHSLAMQEVVKSGLSRFKKSWLKNETSEPFDIKTLDKYYDHSKSTGWQLVLENDGDFSNWPKFTDGKDYIKESYDWQIE